MDPAEPLSSLPARDPLPEAVGPYPILGRLGRGGMGVVYLAEDRRLKRRIAVKVLPARFARDPDALRRFEREARLLASISHPNVAVVHSLEVSAEVPYLTMEVVEGETLGERILRARPDVESALLAARQIAAALEATHRRGILHGDLKPSNVRLTPDGTAKVLDFGLARTLGPDPEETIRLDETSDLFAGTPGYMSPEQLRREPIDERTDVFAFGCVLFECLSGAPAYPGGSLAERLAATLEREPPWSRLPEATPPRIRSLLQRCLQKQPESRPKDFTSIRREIEEELASGPLPRESTPEKVPRSAQAPNNLPRRPASFVGRSRELLEIEELLSTHRLVTITGVGGCGKTRLALEVAHRALVAFPQGVWWVDLAPVSESSSVLGAISRALGLSEQPGQRLEATVGDALGNLPALLVLDNCEHVLPEAARLAEDLFPAAPGLHVLATSRQPLATPGEHSYHLLPLPVPGSTTRDQLAADSVRLFVERSRAHLENFHLDEATSPFVVEICRRLDGIPLALELAAARVRVLSVAEIAERLENRFQLLSTGDRSVLPHHQTLRALVDWSYDYLEDKEQALLRRLSVFLGGWTLEAAERACAGVGIEEWEILDLHSRLLDKSLLEVDVDARRKTGRTRYRMLETVRQYGADRLREAGEQPEFQRRHIELYLELAEEAEPHLRGFGQTDRFIRLGAEHENFRAALDRVVALGLDPVIGLRIAGALGRYWMIRGHWSEGRALCARFLELSADRTGRRARALNAAGNLAFHQGDYEQAEIYHREARDLRLGLGDRFGEAMSWNNLGEVMRMRGDHENARANYEKSLEVYQEMGSDWGAAVALNNLGELAQGRGDYTAARRFHERALLHWPRIGDRWGMAFTLSNLGYVAAAEGDLEVARRHYEKSLALSRELEDRSGTALSLFALGRIAFRAGDRDEAKRQLAESLSLRLSLGDRRGVVDCMEACALLEVESCPVEAAGLLGTANRARVLLRLPRTGAAAEEMRGVEERLCVLLGPEGLARARHQGENDDLEQVARRWLEAGAIPFLGPKGPPVVS